MNNAKYEQQLMYRIVLTCWDRGEEKPYSDCVSGFFDTEEKARTVLRGCVKDELETLNERELTDYDVEYPPAVDDFKADFDGDNDAIIRFWDGDDYWSVTAYNIHKVVLIDKKSWLYRNNGNGKAYYVYQNTKGNRFAVELGDYRLCIKNSLQAALNYIDDTILENQIKIAKGVA